MRAPVSLVNDVTMNKRALVRPAATLAVILTWFAIGGAIGGPTVGKLGEVQENDQSSFLPAGAESTLAGIERDAFVVDNSFPAIIVLDGVTSPAQIGSFHAFVDNALALTLIDGDDRVIGDFIGGEPVFFSSADEEAVIAIFKVPYDAAFEQVDGTYVPVVMTDAIRSAWSEGGAAGDLYVTGAIGVFADTIGAFGGIDSILLYAALIIVFVILLIVYRSPILPIYVLVTASLGLGAVALVVYALADAGAIDLNGQSQGIMSILVVGATTDYALLLISRYREELRRHGSPYDAMKRAWRQTVAPIVASAVTVVLGLLTLLLSNLTSNRSLGPVAALGIVGALFAAMTFLPALLLMGGAGARWVFWPKKPTFHPEEVDQVDTLESVESHAGIWGKVSKAVATHPRRTWVAALVGLVALAAFLPTLKASGVGDDDTFLGEVESIDGLAVLADHFPGGQSDPLKITADADHVDAVVAALEGVDGVSSAYALTPAILAGAPGGVVIEDPVVVDGRVAIDAIAVASSSTQEGKDVVRAVRDAVHAADPTALVGGSAATSVDINLTTDRDLRVIIPMVLLVIFVVLVILLRALVAPLIIVAANVLSFAATMGFSALMFNHVFRFPGSDSAIVLFSFVFLVALGVDYSIFLMSRACEESLKRGTREGIRRGLAVTGGVITSAGIVLAATFGSLAVLPILFLVQMAFIVACGVLIDTLVVRTLLVPGAVFDLDRATWWPWHNKIGA